MSEETEFFGRVSMEPSDSGYVEFSRRGGHLAKWRVTLDGKPVKYVTTADTERRRVKMFATNPDGHIIADKIGGKAVDVVKQGMVRIFYVDVLSKKV